MAPKARSVRLLQRLPELTELVTFVVAAEEESFARAAKRLHISPAAVGKRLDNLEAVLGRMLLERGPRGVRLTADGRQLFAPARRLLEDAQALTDRTRSPEGRASGLSQLLNRFARSPETVVSEIEGLLGRVLHSVSDGIAIHSLGDGRILEVNTAFCELLGYGRDELLGRLPAEVPIWLDEPQHDLLARDGAAHGRRTAQTRSGVVRILDVSCSRLELARERLVLVCARPAAEAV